MNTPTPEKERPHKKPQDGRKPFMKGNGHVPGRNNGRNHGHNRPHDLPERPRGASQSHPVTGGRRDNGYNRKRHPAPSEPTDVKRHRPAEPSSSVASGAGGETDSFGRLLRPQGADSYGRPYLREPETHKGARSEFEAEMYARRRAETDEPGHGRRRDTESFKDSRGGAVRGRGPSGRGEGDGHSGGRVRDRDNVRYIRHRDADPYARPETGAPSYDRASRDVDPYNRAPRNAEPYYGGSRETEPHHRGARDADPYPRATRDSDPFPRGSRDTKPPPNSYTVPSRDPGARIRPKITPGPSVKGRPVPKPYEEDYGGFSRPGHSEKHVESAESSSSTRPKQGDRTDNKGRKEQGSHRGGESGAHRREESLKQQHGGSLDGGEASMRHRGSPHEKDTLSHPSHFPPTRGPEPPRAKSQSSPTGPRQSDTWSEPVAFGRLPPALSHTPVRNSQSSARDRHGNAAQNTKDNVHDLHGSGQASTQPNHQAVHAATQTGIHASRQASAQAMQARDQRVTSLAIEPVTLTASSRKAPSEEHARRRVASANASPAGVKRTLNDNLSYLEEEAGSEVMDISDDDASSRAASVGPANAVGGSTSHPGVPDAQGAGPPQNRAEQSHQRGMADHRSREPHHADGHVQHEQRERQQNMTQQRDHTHDLPQDNDGSQQPAEMNGSYKQITQVGEGTYGKVYKTYDPSTGSLYALKRIRLEAEKDGFPITSLREIKLLQNLKHENVVRLVEMMESKGHVYMVFEYLEHDLTGLLHNESINFGPAHLKSLMQQILVGLEYIHQYGILHRDLKGSNILISRTGLLKIADFGLARLCDFSVKHQDYSNRVITQWYKPPELLLGTTQYGPPIDMWSAGCIFLELFTRKAVFQGRDEIDQLAVIWTVMGTPAEGSWPGVEDLPWYELVRPRVAQPSQFESAFAPLLKSANGMKLAADLLSLNPEHRILCAEALRSEYFTEAPAPEVPAFLAQVEGEWHEFESKRERRKRHRHE